MSSISKMYCMLGWPALEIDIWYFLLQHTHTHSFAHSLTSLSHSLTHSPHLTSFTHSPHPAHSFTSLAHSIASLAHSLMSLTTLTTSPHPHTSPEHKHAHTHTHTGRTPRRHTLQNLNTTHKKKTRHSTTKNIDGDSKATRKQTRTHAHTRVSCANPSDHWVQQMQELDKQINCPS